MSSQNDVALRDLTVQLNKLLAEHVRRMSPRQLPHAPPSPSPDALPIAVQAMFGVSFGVVYAAFGYDEGEAVKALRVAFDMAREDMRMVSEIVGRVGLQRFQETVKRLGPERAIETLKAMPRLVQSAP